MLSQTALIFEDRSAAYVGICEQRTAENQRVLASIVEMSIDPKPLQIRLQSLQQSQIYDCVDLWSRTSLAQ